MTFGCSSQADTSSKPNPLFLSRADITFRRIYQYRNDEMSQVRRSGIFAYRSNGLLMATDAIFCDRGSNARIVAICRLSPVG
jgi:hypothetical protein